VNVGIVICDEWFPNSTMPFSLCVHRFAAQFASEPYVEKAITAFAPCAWA
jgi:hypothetical protein